MNVKGKHLALCGLFCALLAISSKIQLPSLLIPFTLQTAVLLLCVLVLPKFLSTLAVAVYIFAGLLGLPVFASGGGLFYMLKPSFGFILGFLIATFFRLTLNNNGYKSHLITSLLCVLTVHITGFLYAYAIIAYYPETQNDFLTTLIYANLIFIPSDLLWAFVCPLISTKINKVLKT